MVALHCCNEKMRRMAKQLPIHMWILWTLWEEASSLSRQSSGETMQNLQIDICRSLQSLLQVWSQFGNVPVKAFFDQVNAVLWVKLTFGWCKCIWVHGSVATIFSLQLKNIIEVASSFLLLTLSVWAFQQVPELDGSCILCNDLSPKENDDWCESLPLLDLWFWTLISP